MLTSIQSAGVAPEVNLRNSWHAGDEAHKQGIHPGFETQGRHHQKFKTGVSVAPQKGSMSSKNLKKKKQYESGSASLSALTTDINSIRSEQNIARNNAANLRRHILII